MIKRSIATIVCSVLLLSTSYAAGGVKRLKTERQTPTATKQKTQPLKTMPTAPTPGPQPTKTRPETRIAVPQPTDDTVIRPPTPPTQDITSTSATYEINWQTINGGGEDMQSMSYAVQSSLGQSVIGYATSSSYEAGIGYWYGVSGGTVICDCPYQCDYDEDTFLTALDLGGLIDVLFAGRAEEQDPDCPNSRGDFDCDGFPTALDLGGLIDHLFAGGPPPCDPCT